MAIVNFIYKRIRNFRKKYLIDLSPEQERALYEEIKAIAIKVAVDSINNELKER